MDCARLGFLKRLILLPIVLLYTAQSYGKLSLGVEKKTTADELFEQCIKDLDHAAKVISTCNATTYTAPRWYQQPEAVAFLIGLGVSLGFAAGQRLK